MIYKFVTQDQKEFLESLCEALGLEMQDLFNVQYIKDLIDANNKLIKDIEERDKLILDITKELADIKQTIYNMQNEEILGTLYEND